jgi:SOS-response transcriptional repressor LexA
MAAMHTDEERAVALLHDVIEDGDLILHAPQASTANGKIVVAL